MATNTAPGLLKTESFAFLRLPIHNDELWQKTIDQALSMKRENKCRLIGWDIDKRAIEISKANAEAAGVADLIEFEVRDFTTTTDEDVPSERGCIVTDPPYGVRLDSGSAAIRRPIAARLVCAIFKHTMVFAFLKQVNASTFIGRKLKVS